MKAHYRAFHGRLIIEIEGTTVKDLFAQIGPIAEVLDADAACGKCSSPNIYPRAREAQGYDFYELVCSDCGAKLSFGQFKDGSGLFPKRNDKEGAPLDFRGWHIYKAIEAPKEYQQPTSGPRRAPQAKPQATEDRALVALLARMDQTRTANEREEILLSVFEQVAHVLGDTNAQAAWTDALRKYGDHEKRPDSAVPILLHLYGVLKGAA